ncbi:MAG: hypothetical protein HZC48_05415 [Nitrospirae bacterium]|nr:hypothetical protein [Nitrospirota bacterium]
MTFSGVSIWIALTLIRNLLFSSITAGIRTDFPIVSLIVELIVIIIVVNRIRSGKYYKLIKYYDSKLLEKFGYIIHRIIPDNEKIISLTKGFVKGLPALILSTDTKLIVISLNKLTNKAIRAQSLDLKAIINASLKPLSYMQMIQVAFRSTSRIDFNIDNNNKKYYLDFLDPGSAEDLIKRFSENNAKKYQWSSVIQDYCVKCNHIFSYHNKCPVCGPILPVIWKPVFLSILLPGAGQLYNQDLFKGSLFLTSFGLNIIGIMETLIIIKLRTQGIDENVLPSAIYFAIFVWLMNVMDIFSTIIRRKYIHGL